MSETLLARSFRFVAIAKISIFGLLLAIAPGDGVAQIIWSGDYDTGNFLQWHLPSDSMHPQFNGIPKYGRPRAPEPFVGTANPSYYGDGSLLELVTSPVRNGKYAAKFTVKTAKNGDPLADCDNDNCTRRRTELNMHLAMGPAYDGMPYMSERWVSVSHYLPSNWDSVNGTGWGPEVFQLKSPSTNDVSPMLSIVPTNDGWRIYHRWSPLENPNTFEELPWQYQMYYDSRYPNVGDWPDGLLDFPDVSASRAAMADLNKGGWTDWVMRMRFDARGSSEGGTGFLTVWKRAGNGKWVNVLHIVPRRITRGDMTFDHGIGYKVPDSGFGPLAGMYMDLGQVWNLPENRVIYNDNIKIGNRTATFSEMSPDGSVPDSIPQSVRPKPPVLISNQ